MKYYLNTQYNGHRGYLISMGIISETGKCLYLLRNNLPGLTQWVAEHIVPTGLAHPKTVTVLTFTDDTLSNLLEDFFKEDTSPILITDWPTHIEHFCKAMVTAPDKKINTDDWGFIIRNVKTQPNNIQGFVPHNAIWEAIALRHVMTGQLNFFS